jgi:hypothetical protein
MAFCRPVDTSETANLRALAARVHFMLPSNVSKYAAAIDHALSSAVPRWNVVTADDTVRRLVSRVKEALAASRGADSVGFTAFNPKWADVGGGGRVPNALICNILTVGIVAAQASQRRHEIAVRMPPQLYVRFQVCVVEAVKELRQKLSAFKAPAGVDVVACETGFKVGYLVCTVNLLVQRYGQVAPISEPIGFEQLRAQVIDRITLDLAPGQITAMRTGFDAACDNPSLEHEIGSMLGQGSNDPAVDDLLQTIGGRLALAALVLDLRRKQNAPTGNFPVLSAMLAEAVYACGVGWNGFVCHTVGQFAKRPPTYMAIIRSESALGPTEATTAKNYHTLTEIHVTAREVETLQVSDDELPVLVIKQYAGDGNLNTFPNVKGYSARSEYENFQNWTAALLDMRRVSLPVTEADVAHLKALKESRHRQEPKLAAYQRSLGLLPKDDNVPFSSELSDGAGPVRLCQRTIAELLGNHARLYGGVLHFKHAVQITRDFYFGHLPATMPAQFWRWAEHTVCQLLDKAVQVFVGELADFSAPTAAEATPPELQTSAGRLNVMTQKTKETAFMEEIFKCTGHILIVDPNGNSTTNPAMIFTIMLPGMPANSHPAVVHKFTTRDGPWITRFQDLRVCGAPGEGAFDPGDHNYHHAGSFSRGEASKCFIVRDTHVEPSHYTSTVLVASHAQLTETYTVCARALEDKRGGEAGQPDIISLRAYWPRRWPKAKARVAHALYHQCVRCLLGRHFFNSVREASALNDALAPYLSQLDAVKAYLMRLTLDHTASPSGLPNTPAAASIQLIRIADAVAHVTPPNMEPPAFVVTWRNQVVYSTLAPLLTHVFAATMHAKWTNAMRLARSDGPHERDQAVGDPMSDDRVEQLVDHVHGRFQWGQFDLGLDETQSFAAIDPSDESWWHGIAVGGNDAIGTATGAGTGGVRLLVLMSPLQFEASRVDKWNTHVGTLLLDLAMCFAEFHALPKTWVHDKKHGHASTSMSAVIYPSSGQVSLRYSESNAPSGSHRAMHAYVFVGLDALTRPAMPSIATETDGARANGPMEERAHHSGMIFPSAPFTAVAVKRAEPQSQHHKSTTFVIVDQPGGRESERRLYCTQNKISLAQAIQDARSIPTTATKLEPHEMRK